MYDTLLKVVLGSSLDDTTKVSLTKIITAHGETQSENVLLKCMMSSVIFSAGTNWEYKISPEFAKEMARCISEHGIPEIAVKEIEGGGVSIKSSFVKL